MRRVLARLSIRAKLLLITLSVLTTGGVTGAAFLAASYRQSMLEAAHASADALTHTVAEYCAAPLVFEDRAGAKQILAGLASQPAVQGASLLDDQGRVFAHYRRSGASVAPLGQLADVLLSEAPVLHQSAALGRLRVETDTTEVRERIRATMWRIVGASVVLVVICALLALRLQTVITGPLERLASTMRRVGSEGALHERLAHDGGTDEIAALYERFNTMLSQLSAHARERERTQLWLRALIDSLPDQVFVFDEHGQVIRVLGDSKVAAVAASHASVHDLLPPAAAAKLLEGIERTAALNRKERVEYEIETGELTRRYEAVLAPLADTPDDAKAARVLAVARDVTERFQLQNQLLRSQKLQALGQLAGGIAHDFNNLLTGIVGFAELVKLGREPDRAATQILEISDRAGGLVRQLLAFSRKGAPKQDVADVNELLGRVEGILEHTLDPRIQLRIAPSSKACLVRGDASQLESAILNLAVNARDSMPEGGTLAITTRRMVLDEAALKGLLDANLPEGSYVEIAVADTGCGIAKDDLDRIFEPFFTTKEAGRGTGLGLSAVYGTLRSHRGTVQVQSQPGRGSVFRLFLPLEQEASLPAAAPALVEGRGRLMLVDDEDMVLETASQLLQRLGYEVVSFDRPREALSYFERNHASVDAVVLDMVMPQMNGAELAQRLERIRPGIPMMVASGYLGVDEELPSPTQVPGLKLLSKPYSLVELSVAVRELLDERPSKPVVRA